MAGFFEALARQKSNGILAAWIVGGKNAGAKALFTPEEAGCPECFREDSFPEEAAAKIRGLSTKRTGILEIGDSRVFLEWISGGRKLVVCGAGHVSQVVIRLGAMLGYEVTVIEDREEYAEKALAAGAHRVICRPFGEALDGIVGDTETAFVIMTREHAHDVECLRRILRKPSAYIGMMGSRSRSASVRKQLLEEGMDAERVKKVHMPIGLPIGSRTPEEIAVSVLAELIQVMNAADSGEGLPEGIAEELAETENASSAAKAADPEKATRLTKVLAIITEKTGEAPRNPGTKMLVREDGSFLGTAGGGSAEAKVLHTAAEMIRDGGRECRLLRIPMTKGTMHCGGEIAVFLLPV